MIPESLIVPEVRPEDWLKGDIAYEDRCDDWSKWMTTKEPQKFKFDSNGCTQTSGINSVEVQMNMLKSSMSIEALRWFTDNGYFDDNGNFDFSWRYTGIKAGCSINGSSHKSFWDSVRKWGLLPRRCLNYTMERSMGFSSQTDMCADFWDPSVITPEMEELAKGALKWVDFEYEYSWFNLGMTCPQSVLDYEIRHAPLHIGAPVCPDWNSGSVTACGSTRPAHSTLLWDAKPRIIRDHYNPYDKTLSPDYFIPIVVKGVVTLKRPKAIGDQMVELTTISRLLEILRKLKIWPLTD